MKNIAGQKFWHLTVIEACGRNDNRQVLWHCSCDCGGSTIVSGTQLRRSSRPTKSCGCKSQEARARNGRANATHGMTCGGKSHPMYLSWRNMHIRCTKPSSKDYYLYGGIGIKVCQRWNDFVKFQEDMGESWKEGLTLDRIDFRGNYEPGNCRWATRLQQARNRRKRGDGKSDYEAAQKNAAKRLCRAEQELSD